MCAWNTDVNKNVISEMPLSHYRWPRVVCDFARRSRSILPWSGIVLALAHASPLKFKALISIQTVTVL